MVGSSDLPVDVEEAYRMLSTQLEKLGRMKNPQILARRRRDADNTDYADFH